MIIIIGHRYKVTFMATYCEFLFCNLPLKQKIVSLKFFCASRLLTKRSNIRNRRVDYIIFANIVARSIINDNDLNQELMKHNMYLYDNKMNGTTNDDNNYNNNNNNSNDASDTI